MKMGRPVAASSGASSYCISGAMWATAYSGHVPSKHAIPLSVMLGRKMGYREWIYNLALEQVAETLCSRGWPSTLAEYNDSAERTQEEILSLIDETISRVQGAKGATMLEKIDSFRGKYYFLSNFYPVEIEYEGITYPSSECAYRAAKADDPQIRLRISKMTSAEAKSAGKFLVREDWHSISLQVMLNILRIKFAKRTMKEKLLETGDAEIIEGNTWKDYFWGVCDGKGDNHLGKILMQIREELRSGQ
jgi:ribA/ribD-fused uncharacterized protein